MPARRTKTKTLVPASLPLLEYVPPARPSPAAIALLAKPPRPTRKGRSEILERDVETALAQDWKQNKTESSRERLILAYRPLAIGLAENMARHSGMTVEDLVQEAFLALAECFDKFDPSLGNRFGTFARWHIKGQLKRHVMDFFGPCRIGTNLADKKVFMKFRRLRALREAATQRPLGPQDYEAIAKEIGVPTEVVARMAPRLSSHDVSLDETIDEGDGTPTTRGAMLVDGGPTPEQAVMDNHDQSQMRQILSELIANLPERERQILSARLFADQRAQLADLGQELGITKERVRQLERKALKQLKRDLHSRGITREDVLRP